MTLEIEAKLRVDSHDPVRQKLRALGAEDLGCVLESNDIFDGEGGPLRQRGRGLRVRATQPVEDSVGSAVRTKGNVADGHTSKPTTTLTVKGPVISGTFKTREEHEVNVADAGQMTRVLRALGFSRVLSYQKRRESWRLDECRIELDEPPHIGLFVEIEGPDEDAIRSVQKRLGLGDVEHVRTSYVHMLADYCQAHHIKERVLTLPPAN